MAESKYYGLYQGIVVDIKDPEKRGRIRVKCPDVLGGSTKSAWCDPLVPVAYDNGGDFCIPSLEETVWIQFIAGDANRPVYMGGWWQKNMTPLGKNYSDVDLIRIINYADCTIKMQDGRIDINVGEGAFDLSIQNGKVTVVGELEVQGALTAYSVSAGFIEAVVGEGSDGSITAETLEVANSTKTKTLNATAGITGGTLSVKTSGTIQSLTVEETIEANEVIAETSVEANGVSLTEHVHGGVTSGGELSGMPE